MLKYRYVFCGDFYRKKIINKKLQDDHDYYNFNIEVSIPINYNNKKDAIKCPCSLRFEKNKEGHVVLNIYRRYTEIKEYSHSWLQGMNTLYSEKEEIIETIKWEEYWKYKISRSKKISKDMNTLIKSKEDYVPDATPWDELFDIKNQPKDWSNKIESLSYRIDIIEEN